jgi:hypothetical protein
MKSVIFEPSLKRYFKSNGDGTNTVMKSQNEKAFLRKTLNIACNNVSSATYANENFHANK